MFWQTNLRTLVEQTIFSQERAQLSKDFAHFDSAWTALSWTLVRHPESGLQSEKHSNLFLYSQEESVGGIYVPEIVVIYSFDEDEIILHRITCIDHN